MGNEASAAERSTGEGTLPLKVIGDEEVAPPLEPDRKSLGENKPEDKDDYSDETDKVVELPAGADAVAKTDPTPVAGRAATQIPRPEKTPIPARSALAKTDKKTSRKQPRNFSEGALRGTIEINNENDLVKDPILDAVGAGSAVRKARYEEMRKVQHSRFFAENNEWKNSLRLLAKTAASTAKTVARVTAPVVTDARQIVVSSATEFAHDVRKEWEKGIETAAPPTHSSTTSSSPGELQTDSGMKGTEPGLKGSCEQTKNDSSVSFQTSISNEKVSDAEQNDMKGDVGLQLSFDKKKEIDGTGGGDETDNTNLDRATSSPKKSIYEELQIMEERFENRIESVKSQIDLLASPREEKDEDNDEPKTSVLFSHEDYLSKLDFDENGTEITFSGKHDEERETGPVGLSLLSNSIDKSFVTTDEHLDDDEELESRLTEKEIEIEEELDDDDEYKHPDEQDPIQSDKCDKSNEEAGSIDLEPKAETKDNDERHVPNDLPDNEKDQNNYTPLEEKGDINERTEHHNNQLKENDGDEPYLGEDYDVSKDQDPILPQEPKVRTKSGRVVKPVRRLVDGYDVSIGGKDQYGMIDNEMKEENGEKVEDDEDEKECNVLNDENINRTQTIDDTEEKEKTDQGFESETFENEDQTLVQKLQYVSSRPSVIPEIKDTIRGTPDPSLLTLANTEDGKLKRKSAEKGSTTNLSDLFSSNEDSLYQKGDNESGRGINGSLASKERVEKDALENLDVESKQSYFFKSLKDRGLKDKKSIIKFVVTKLTGLDIEIQEKSNNFDLFDKSNDYPIADSIFNKETIDEPEPSSTTSSLSSPPEVDMCDECESRDTSKGEIDEMFTLFDCIPDKRELPQELPTQEGSRRFQPQFLEESAHRRRLMKLGSAESMNDSLGSFSTQQKSFKSMPFSPKRSNRKLRRQGSKLSLSVTNTLSTKSPLATPIENRSLVDDKYQTDVNQIDHRGQLVGWDTSITEPNFSSVPDTEEMTDAHERSGHFYDTLVAFSSLENVEFLKECPLSKPQEVPRTMSSLVWRQLTAYWKHSESFNAMSTRPSSIRLPDCRKHPGFVNVEDEFSSSTTTIQFRFDSCNVVFADDFVASNAYSLLRHSRGDNNAVEDEEFFVLTRYLCDIGPIISSPVGNGNGSVEKVPLRHNLATNAEGGDCRSTPSITDIHGEAKAQLPVLKAIISQIVNYSTQNYPSSSEPERDVITSSLGVKDYSSVQNKARRKYDDDPSQVKDVLRGEITFPDEGSLVCGLYSLYSLAERGNIGEDRKNENMKQVDSTPCFRIVRLKNLFRTTSGGNEFDSTLPTGYRHILVNIRFTCGLIAGKSLSLFSSIEFFRSRHSPLPFDRIAIPTGTAFRGNGCRRIHIAPRYSLV